MCVKLQPQGCCRTANGSTGTFVTDGCTSFAICEGRCINRGDCYGFEYHHNDQYCELHLSPDDFDHTSQNGCPDGKCYQCRTPSPTLPPASTPTTVPTNTPISGSCSAFSPIAGLAGTTVLSNLDGSDDSTELVTLPFAFNWLGAHPVTLVRVSTNGAIFVATNNTPYNQPLCCSAMPIEHGSTPSRISVMHEDLDPGDYGTVFTRYISSPDEAFIISWEGVAFHSQTGEVNAQAVLYPGGNVELRWGATNGGDSHDRAAAGIVDASVSPQVVLPATVQPFESNGVTPVGQFPQGKCQLFALDSSSDDDTPPSAQPTATFGDNTCSATADVAVLMDGSGSVGSSNFVLMKNFAKDVMAQFNIGASPLDSRGAVVTFSHASSSAISPLTAATFGGAGSNAALLTAAIDSIPFYGGYVGHPLACRRRCAYKHSRACILILTPVEVPAINTRLQVLIALR